MKQWKNDIYLSSDTLSFAPYVDKILVVDNGQMLTIHPIHPIRFRCKKVHLTETGSNLKNKIILKNIKSGKTLPLTFEKIPSVKIVPEKKAFPILL